MVGKSGDLFELPRATRPLATIETNRGITEN
jgi:hypothetical protein